MLVTRTCLECGHHEELPVNEGLITCSECGTRNDVWIESEAEPERHKRLNVSTGMKGNEQYKRFSRNLTAWIGNYGTRVTLDLPMLGRWNSLMISAGIRRSKLMQFWPIRFDSSRSSKGVRIGFGLVHFTIVYRY